MNYKKLLKSKKFKIAVWGTGYIGLSTMVYFSKKNINEINFKKFNSKKTIILLIGIFHHIDDLTIKSFLSKTKNFIKVKRMQTSLFKVQKS